MVSYHARAPNASDIGRLFLTFFAAGAHSEKRLRIPLQVFLTF